MKKTIKVNSKKTIKFLITALFVSLTFTLCGCDEVQIFKDKVNPYEIIKVKDKNMEDDAYYIKEGTDFAKIYLPNGSHGHNEIGTLKPSRVCSIAGENENLVPDCYKNELIAFMSNSYKNCDHITLERYKDYGYSIGCFNGTYLTDTEQLFLMLSNIDSNSSLYEKISEISSESNTEVRIEKINGRYLSKDNINISIGTIANLEKDKDYKVGLYIGTKYYELDVKADTHILGAYELFYYDREYIQDTPNGYMAFSMPADVPSGYYFVNGEGLFKYFNYEKGMKDNNNEDMNVAFYKDERSKIEAYSKQYKVSIPNRCKDLKINVSFYAPDDTIDTEDIQGIVYSSDNKKYEMNVNLDEEMITLNMSEAVAGNWTLNIIPRTLEILDVNVENSKFEEQATCEESQLILDDGAENMQIIAEYKNNREEEGTVYGSILVPDGTVYDMELEKVEKEGITSSTPERERYDYFIKYELPYAPAGSYTVRIYHFPEETTIMPPEIKNKIKVEKDVIIIND